MGFPRSRMVQAALAAALPLAAVAALVPGAIFRGEAFWVSDLGAFHRPIRSLLLRLANDSGGLPAWNPYLALGQPYAANPHHALFHPTTALFFLLPFETAFRLQVLLPVLAAFAAMVFFLKTQGRSLAASLFGGLSWAFGGTFLSGTILLPIALTLAPMPATLAFAMRLARGRRDAGGRWRDLAGCALMFGLQGLGGEPGALLITLGLLPVAALDGLLHGPKKDRARDGAASRETQENATDSSRPEPAMAHPSSRSSGSDSTVAGKGEGSVGNAAGRLSSAQRGGGGVFGQVAARTAARLALAAALGLGVAGAALVPGAVLAAKSSRAAAGGISRAEAEIWSMPPARALELVFPRSLGYLDLQWDEEGWYWAGGLYPKRGRPFLFSIHAGALPLVLALVGFVRERRRFAPWIAAGAAGLLLALGPSGLLWTAARWTVPLFASVRYPERWILAATFVLALGAARGFDALFERPGEAQREARQALRQRAPRRLARGALGVLAGVFAAGAAAAWIASAAGGGRLERLGLPARVASQAGGVLARDLLLACGLATAAAVLASLAGPGRRRAWVAAALTAIAAADLVHAFRPYALTESPEVLGAPPPLFQRLLAERPTGPIFHYAAYDRTARRQEDLAAPPVPALWGLATTLEQDFDVSELSWSRAATKRFFEASVSDPDLVGPLLARRGVEAIVRVRAPARHGGRGRVAAQQRASPAGGPPSGARPDVSLRGASPSGAAPSGASPSGAPSPDTSPPGAPQPWTLPGDLSTASPAPLREEVEGDILRPSGRLPVLACLERVERAAGEGGWLAAVRSLKHEASRTAIVDPADAGAAEVPARPGACVAALVARTPVSLVARVVSRGPAPSLLAVNQTWDTGWSASIDGAPARVVRTDLCLSAIVVPAGEHRVELTYRDPWLWRGIVVSCVSLAVCASLVVLSSLGARSVDSGDEER